MEFVGFIIDVVLCLPVALVFTLIAMMLLYAFLSVLMFMANFFMYLVAYFSDQKMTWDESRQRMNDAYGNIDMAGFNSKATNTIFIIIYILCVYVSAVIDGFPFPYLIGGS
jgi:hypothetical protein